MVETQSERAVLDAILDQAIASIDQRVGAQLALVCDHPDLIALQSLWMGLHALVGSVGQAQDIFIDLLNCSKEELTEDFEYQLDLTGSALFHNLYKTEYDQAGGRPYTAVLMQYAFSNTVPDIALLRQISKVAASCHCPALVNGCATLFGSDRLEAIEEIEDFDLLFDTAQYTRWRSFSQSEDTRYLGMVFPRVMVGFPVKRQIPRWCRHRDIRDPTRAWTPAVNALGIILVRSFAKYGWCVYIRGTRTGGLIEELEGADLGLEGLALIEPPLEILFSDRQEHEFAAQGLIPLCWNRQRERVCLYSAPTLQNVSRLRSETGRFDRLAASLPYLFLISRIAHYQKVIQRENIGLFNDSKQLQTELERWLEKLVTTMRDPTMVQRSERPLAGGFVRVEEDPATPGFFRVQLVVQPHLQLEGVNAKLELATKMPQPKE